MSSAPTYLILPQGCCLYTLECGATYDRTHSTSCLAGHNISQSLIDRNFEVNKRYFNMPAEEKAKLPEVGAAAAHDTVPTPVWTPALPEVQDLLADPLCAGHAVQVDWGKQHYFGHNPGNSSQGAALLRWHLWGSYAAHMFLTVQQLEQGFMAAHPAPVVLVHACRQQAAGGPLEVVGHARHR